MGPWHTLLLRNCVTREKRFGGGHEIDGLEAGSVPWQNLKKLVADSENGGRSLW